MSSGSSTTSTLGPGAGLADFVRGGKGLVALHFACGAFGDWPEYVNLIGRVWDKSKTHDPLGPFRVHVVKKDHPITRGLEDFDITDELYFCLMGKPQIEVLLAAAVCGVSFAGTQFAVSNFVGPQLTDILSSLAAIASLVVLFVLWHPKDIFHFPGNVGKPAPSRPHSPAELLLAWGPYGLLVIFVLLWGWEPVRLALNRVNVQFPWPALHNLIERMPPVVDLIYSYEKNSYMGRESLQLNVKDMKASD